MKEIIYRLKRYWHLISTGWLEGAIAAWRTGHPEKKLKIIVVTGTDGKTTSSSLIYHLLRMTGHKVGLISTVAAYIGHQELDTGFHVTAPCPRDLYRFMAQMVNKKIEYLVLEATSQGVYQYRTWGIEPEVAALTNLDREHLDYHVTAENYWRAKLLILGQSRIAVMDAKMPELKFALEELRRIGKAVAIKKNTNLEPEEELEVLRQSLKSPRVIYYGQNLKFGLELEKVLKKKFSQEFNQLNARLALTVAGCVGVKLHDKDEEKKIIQAINDFKLPRGRMQELENNLGVKLIVDFAHTSQALKAALQSIRAENPHARIISIYGCAGFRDRQKRPVMGRIGAELSDIVVFTAEDPRTENIWSIINQMKGDLGEHYGKVISIANRREAIEFVLEKIMKKGDVIAIFGKGHEKSMNYGHGEELWNDIEFLEGWLKKHAKN